MQTKRAREKSERDKSERVPTALLGLKAPVEWFEKLDAWRELQDFTPKPSRPAAIRYIVWRFLDKEAQRAAKRPKRR